MVTAEPCSAAVYREELDYLIEYARTDRLHFHPIEGAATLLAGAHADAAARRGLMLRLVGDLLAAGARPTDMVDGPDVGYVPWPVGREEALERIGSEIDATDDSVDLIDICWFTFPGNDH